MNILSLKQKIEIWSYRLLKRNKRGDISGNYFIAFLFFSILFSFININLSNAATRYAVVASGAWNSTTTWAATSGGAAGQSIPIAGDIVFIGEGTVARAITIPAGYTANCTTLNIGDGTATGTANPGSSLTLSASNALLNVSGNMVITRSTTTSAIMAFNVNAGVATIGGSLTYNGTSSSSRTIRVVITNGTLTIGTDLVINSSNASTNVIDMSGGAGTINVGGAFTGGTSANATFTPGTTSTFNYNGAAAQTVVVASSSYANLTLSGGGVKTLATGTTTINGNLTIAGNTTSVTAVVGLGIVGNFVIGSGPSTSVFNAGSFTHTIGGSLTNNGTFNANTSTISFTTAAAGKTIGGTSPTTFNNLTLNCTNGVSISGAVDVTVNGILNFTSGVFTTTSNQKLILGSAGSVSRTSGHVNGNFQKNFSSGAGVTRNFEVGDATAANYTPVSVTFTNVTSAGNLILSSTAGDHNLAGSVFIATSTVNRYWTLALPASGGVAFDNYNATFTYLAGDVDAGVNPLTVYCGKFDLSGWTYPSLGTLTATTAQVTGVSTMGDFQFGDCPRAAITIASVTNSSCNGASDGIISITTTGGDAPLSYLWSPGSIITQDISSIAAGTYTVRVTTSRGCTSTASATVVQASINDDNPCTTDACDLTAGTISHTPVNIDDGTACTTDDCNTLTGSITHIPTMVITGQPSSVTVCEGSSPGFTVVASGTGNTYQWQEFISGSFQDISGATGSTLNLSNVAFALNGGQYQCLVNGACPTLTTNAVTLTVNPTTVSGNFNSDVSICSGLNTGDINLLNYTGSIIRWEFSFNGTTWTTIANTTPTYTYNNLTTTTLYRAVVKSGLCAQLNSSVATISVDRSLSITTQPTNLTVCEGSNASFSIAVAGTDSSFQWQDDQTGSFTDIAGATSNILTLTNVVYPTMNGRQYRCIVNGACPSVTSNSVILTVDPATNPGVIIPDALTICSGTNTDNLNLIGYVGSILRWEFSFNGTTWTIISPSNTTSTLTFNNLNTTTIYRAVVKSGVCSAFNSPNTAITVNQSLAIGTQPVSVVTCDGTTTGFTVAATGTGVSYQWQNNHTGTFTDSAGATGSTLSLVTVTPDMSGRQYRCIVSGACPSLTSSIATLTVDSTTVPGILTPNAFTVCEGANTGTVNLSGYRGSIIRWEFSYNGTTWTTLSPANTTPSLTFTNLITTTQYRAVVKSGSCSELYSTVSTVTVNAALIINTQPTNLNACQGSSPAFTIAAAGQGLTFQWWDDQLGSFNPIAGATGNTLSFPNVALSYSGRHYYCVVSGGCPAITSNTVTLTVSPPTVAGVTSPNAGICSGTNTGTITLSGHTGNVVRWESTINGGLNWSSIGNNTPTLTYNNLNTTTIYHAIVKSGGCSQLTSTNDTITVYQSIVISTQPVSVSVCEGSNTGFSIVAGGDAIAFQWQNDSVTPGSFVNITGQTANTISLSNVTTLMSGRKYRCVLTGVCSSQMSNEVTLTVSPNTVAGVVNSSMNVCTGTNTGTLNLVGSVGSVLRWEFSFNGTTWSTVSPGNTTTSLTFNNITATTQYRAVVKSGGCAQLNSTVAVATLYPSTVITTQPVSKHGCELRDTTFVVAATGNALSYQWQDNQTGSFTDTVGATSPTLTLSPINLSMNLRQYRCAVLSATCPTVNSNVAVLSVDSATNGGVAGPNATLCSTTNSGTITLTGYTGSILKWVWNTTNNLTNTTPVQTYTNLTASRNYQAQVKSGVCPSTFSVPAAITYNASGTSIFSQPANTVVCDSTDTGFLIQANGIHLTFQWQNDSVTPNSFVNMPGRTYDTLYILGANFSMNGWHYRCIVTGDCGAPVISNIATLTVQSRSLGGHVSSNAVVCAGNNTGTLNLSGQNGSVIRWESSIDNGTIWSPITNTSTSLTYTNVPVNTLFRAVVQNGICVSANSDSAIISMNPLSPNSYTITGGGTFCSNTPGNVFGLNGSDVGVNYRLLSGATPVGSIIPGTGSPISFGTFGTGTYSVVATHTVSSCSRTLGPITLSVIPAPIVTASATATNFCPGGTSSLSSTSTITTTAPTTLTANVNTAIPDNITTTGVTSTISVSGAPATFALVTGLSVKINVNHTKDNDIEAYLIRPGGTISTSSNGNYGNTIVSGQSICLVADQGSSSGVNFTNTVFSDAAANSITTGSAPFTGSYKPQDGTFSGFTTSANPNGVWTIKVYDDGGSGTTGTFVNWSITMNLLGGVSYTWSSTPAGFTSTVQNPGTVSPLVTTIYSVTVTDLQNGCPSTATAPVNVFPPVVLNCTVQNNGCNGANNGVALISTTSGTAPFVGTGSKTGLTPGIHTYTVTDAHNCSSTCSVDIVEPPVLNSSASVVSHISCFGFNNGSAQVTATGGTQPYSSDGLQSGLSPGPHNFTVTDANGCTTVSSVTINEPTQLVASHNVTQQVTCFEDNNGSVEVSATGGTPVYTGTGTFDNLTGGLNIFTVTDSKGCTATTSVTTLVADVQPPVISNCPNDTIVQSNGACTMIVSWTEPTATDNCSFNVTKNINPGSVFPVGTTTVTYTATDLAGNASTCSFHVIVINSSSFTAIACDTFYLPWGGLALASGNYNHTYLSSLNCDSVVTAQVTIINTSDNNPCTADGCISIGVFYHIPLTNTGGGESDGIACTQDNCDNGTTFHVPITDFNDNNPCTTDGCSEPGGVFHTPLTNLGGGEDDGSLCTEDNCDNGITVHPSIPTDDGNPCTFDACSEPGGVFHIPLTNTGGGATDGLACTQDNCDNGTTFHTAFQTDDGNVCTTDGCSEPSGVFHTPLTVADAGESDGLACTYDNCDNGRTVHPAIPTGDNNPCTIDACSEPAGVFHIPLTSTGGGFSDGLSCTQDNCDNGTTVHPSIPIPDDNNICTEDGCSELTGIYHLPLTNTGGGASDGLAGTQDNCDNGSTVHPPVITDDGNPCTEDGTVEPTGVYHTPLTNIGGGASDDLLCTQDNCDNGTTVHPPLTAIDDGNACTDDACDSSTGSITHTPLIAINDGNACTDDACDTTTGSVTHTPLADIDDGNACTDDACNTSTGSVTHTALITINDNNACTDDACDTTTGSVTHTALVAINDGNPCTDDACNTSTGSVTHTALIAINDGNVCTEDACDTSNGSVTHTPLTNSDGGASDGNACTQDNCDNGTTVHPPLTAIDDINACTDDACNTSTGSITHTPLTAINDGNACTDDACDTSTGSVTHTPLAEIDDSNACTDDACNTSTGSVTHSALTAINDGNACTDDACDTSTGSVTHTPLAEIDDSNACTDDACNTSTGSVTHSALTAINDGNACTDDACDTSTGSVTHTALTAINDGNACTDDACDTSTGSVTHTPLAEIEDSNACTDDACDTSTGSVTHTALIAINDGNACTDDACDISTGSVTHTALSTIDDGNACTDDACDTFTGSVTHTALTAINDGNACTDDACNTSTGSIAHTALITINDGNICTEDACDTDNGSITHTPLTNSDGGASDGNACTQDNCDSGTTVHPPLTTIDDSNACTDDACDTSTGSITHTALTTINDGNVCTEDACDTDNGSVTHTPLTNSDGGASDGNSCTQDNCDNGTTVHSPLTTIDDSNACTDDACDTSTGSITHTALAAINDSNACTDDACDTSTGSVTHIIISGISDGNACTDDACNTSTGSITHTALASINDGNLCTEDACDTDNGSITHSPLTNTNGGENDGNACTQDNCDNGTTVHLPLIAIDDSDACTDDACDTSTGSITHTPLVLIDDGDACTDDACDTFTGSVTHTTISGISDGNACTDDACDSSTGSITHTALIAINDGNVCTEDACDTDTGSITHTPLTNTNVGENDGNACTQDNCDNGTTVHPPLTAIDDSNACTDDACDTSTGSITHTSLSAIDDGNACTDDACDTLTGSITHTALVTINDNNICTDDACDTSTGSITHTSLSAIDDGNACTDDACDTSTGSITHTAIAAINDGSACTDDACDTSTGSVTHTALISIDDNNLCTIDVCDPLNGTTSHAPLADIDDNNVCTTDVCDSSTGTTSHLAVTNTGGGATDNNACTEDNCDNGTTVHPALTNIDDNNICTTDVCNTANGTTSHTPLTNTGGGASDGLVCTQDNCANGTTVHPPVNPDDNNPCTSDACVEGTGVINTPLTNSGGGVNDGLVCTEDNCFNGSTVHPTVNIPDDLNPCTTDGCSEPLGIYHSPLTSNGGGVSDGFACTQDNCDYGLTVHPPAVTDDNNPCTDDGCLEPSGVYHTNLSNTGGGVSDGLVCTHDDCSNGTTVHPPVSIPDDFNVCTADGCSEPLGIYHSPLTTLGGGVPDGLACTQDNCDNGTTVHPRSVTEDNNPCTADGCSEPGGVFHSPLTSTGGGASDGLICTEDNCFNGSTVHPTAATDDNNPCTSDGCSESLGVFHLPLTNTNGGSGDGLICTQDNCNNGSTVHPPIATTDGNPCTADGCSEPGGVFHIPLTNTSGGASDGLACTQDNCISGSTVHPLKPTDDNNPCTTDGCVEPTGLFHTPLSNLGSGANDGLACTQDNCVNGTTVHPAVVVPDDNNPCTINGCSEPGGIFYSPITISGGGENDGNSCTQDNCDNGTTVHSIITGIDDSNACTNDVCNTSTGSISHTALVTINDGNACTDDACESSSGSVTHTTLATIDDGNACTDDACNTLTGSITHTALISIDDGNACTSDDCDTSTGSVTHNALTNSGLGESDGNACTEDNCDNGTTVHSLITTIDDGNACTDDACDTSTGSVTHTALSTIDDGNACTDDACDTSTGSVTHIALATIDDGNACTDDACDTSTGSVTHTDLTTINDGNACTDDACDTSTGSVTHTALLTINDGNACTDDACDTSTGSITHTTLQTIDDGNACTDDACDTSTGSVTHTALSTIDDGNACTDDACDTSAGSVTHTALATINDGNACTDDACDTSTGSVTHTALSTIDDGNACTDDACDTSTGSVTHTVLATIDDGNACTVDACNTSTGSVTHTIPAEICGNNIDDNCNGFIDEGCNIPLSMKIYLEGYYIGAGTMRACLYNNYLASGDPGYVGPSWSTPAGPTDCDTLTISAMDPVTFSLIQVQKGILKTNGQITVYFTSPVIIGNRYFIRVTHRNALETWSESSVLFDGTSTYDFTTSLNNAYSFGVGNPDMMHQMFDGPWALLTGDISNSSIAGVQDGNIDLYDFSTWENSNSNFIFGYLPEDFNGDVNVDLLDLDYWEYNNSNFAYTQHP